MDDVVPLAALEGEWRALVRGRLAAAFRKWTAADQALAPFTGPTGLIAFLRGEASAEAKNRVLFALVARARVEPLAGRMVLEAMLPGLKRLAGRLLEPSAEYESESALDRDELWQVLFCAKGLSI